MAARRFHVALVLFLLAALTPAHMGAEGAKPVVVLDIPSLVGKTPAEVDSILGEPTDVQTASCHGLSCPRHVYRSGKIEIVFVRGRADWITVFPDSLPYRKESLKSLGFQVTDPTFSNPQHMRWEGTLLGYREVALFAGERLPSGGTKVWYAYAYAYTLP